MSQQKQARARSSQNAHTCIGSSDRTRDGRGVLRNMFLQGFIAGDKSRADKNRRERPVQLLLVYAERSCEEVLLIKKEILRKRFEVHRFAGETFEARLRLRRCGR